MGIMFLVLFTCMANFILGFALAMHLGHGPPSLPGLDQFTQRAQGLAKRKDKSHEPAH